MKCQIQLVLQCASVLQIEIEHKYECMYKVFQRFSTSDYAIELPTLYLFYRPIQIETLNDVVLGFSELGILFQICAKVFKLIVV